MFSPEGFVEDSIAALRNEVDDIAVIACSGGVDSKNVTLCICRHCIHA